MTHLTADSQVKLFKFHICFKFASLNFLKYIHLNGLDQFKHKYVFVIGFDLLGLHVNLTSNTNLTPYLCGAFKFFLNLLSRF